MQLRDVGLVRQHLENSVVFGDVIWERPAVTVTPFDLTMFHARMSAHGLAKGAVIAIDVLQTEAIKELARGNLGNAPFVRHVLAEPRFVVDELLQGLERLSLVRRQACLYALEVGLDPKVVTTLTWKDILRDAPNQQLAIDIIRKRNAVRHIRLDYVFWEFATVTIAAPLFHLEDSVQKAFRRNWNELRLGYKGMLMVDGQAEAASFQEAIKGR